MNIFEIYLEKIKSIISELQKDNKIIVPDNFNGINAEIPCLLYTSPSPRDSFRSRMPSSA